MQADFGWADQARRDLAKFTAQPKTTNATVATATNLLASQNQHTKQAESGAGCV